MKLPIQAAPVLRDSLAALMRPFAAPRSGMMPSMSCSGVCCPTGAVSPNCQWCCPTGDECGSNHNCTVVGILRDKIA